MIFCLLVNVAFRGVIAEFEAISTPFLMEHHHLTYSAASFRISFIGLPGLLIYMSFKPIARPFSDRALLLVGLCTFVAGCAALAVRAASKAAAVPEYVALLAFTWSVAYPVGQTAVLSLSSKVLVGLPVGDFLGVFSASGSVARVVFAMLAGVVWSRWGREAGSA